LQLASADDPSTLPVLRCRRVARNHMPPAAYQDAASTVVMLASDRASRAIIKQAWDPVVARAALRLMDANAAMLREAPLRDAGVVHMFGRLEEERDSVVFNMGVTRTRRGPHSEAAKAEGFTLDEAQGLGAQDVLSTFPRVSLVILQPRLLEDPAARDTSDRDDAMLVRKFAGELFSLGVPAVLVLPRLDSPRASIVAGLAARAVARKATAGAPALEAAVVDIQRAIARALASAPPDVVYEIQFDTCLFCVDGWDGRLTQGPSPNFDPRPA